MGNYSDFYQVIDDLQTLNITIEDIRQRIVTSSQVAYTSQDARHVALDGIQCDIGACGNWINALRALRNICQEKFANNWDEEYRRLLGTGLTCSQAEDLMLDYLRNTLITKVHFKIENLFANILKDLNALPPKKRGFWNLSDAMLKQVDISTTGREKEILTVLASLRNSFHANGIHNNNDLSAAIDGAMFEFRNGKPVECASWWHIVVLLRANFSVLQSILLSKNVSKLTHEIRDDYSWRQSLPP